MAVLSMAMLNPKLCCTYSIVVPTALLYSLLYYIQSCVIFMAKYMFMAVLHEWLYYIQSHVCSQLHYIHGSVTNSQTVAVKLYAHCFVTIY